MPSEERKIYEDIFSAADKKLQEEQIKHTPQGPRYYGGYRSYYN
jgi:hypothetical protein